MAIRATKGNFRLVVPLDASGIKDFKPDRPVKVVAFDEKGNACECLVKLDAKGLGTAFLAFEEHPGNVHLVVGPENATAEQMKGLQTINLDVAARLWGDKKELAVSPVLISTHYWLWWIRWCRKFKITGVVRCANGDPVPGARVCAYDVDWWWWWWCNQQVGCATTDESGSFEIDFTWCCGWWPWWWWAHRKWLLEPGLAERITHFLRKEAKLVKLPPPGPRPDPAVFHALLGDSASLPVLRRSLKALTMLKLETKRAEVKADIDPASLDGLRKQLVTVLPQSPEFEKLSLWPWWPWFPWWDCTPDIIFKVTQDFEGQEQVIVNESIWDARWNINTSLSLTLVANENAHCVTGTTCLDGNDCSFISDVCEDNLDYIGGNPGASSGASQKGYLYPGAGGVDSDRPYSGTIPLRGCLGNTVDYYEFLVSTSGFAGPWSPLPAAAAGGFYRSYWDSVLHKWVSVPFPFTALSDGAADHNVIESLPHYEANNGAKLWDAFTADLLMQFTTNGILADGTYYLRMQGWHRAGYAGNLSGPVNLPVCGSTDPNGVVIAIDNHLVTAGPADLNGHLCGSGTAHVCTAEPDTEILAVTIVHGDGTTTPLGACGQVTINDTDLLQIDFVAYDPDPLPHLRNYELSLHYDVDLVNNLLLPGLIGWSLAPSPVSPSWATAAAQVGPNYDDANPLLSALDQGAVSPHWAGGAVRLTVLAKQPGVFPETCCYQLALYAYKRTIGGGGKSCNHTKWNQWNRTEVSFTVNV